MQRGWLSAVLSRRGLPFHRAHGCKATAKKGLLCGDWLSGHQCATATATTQHVRVLIERVSMCHRHRNHAHQVIGNLSSESAVSSLCPPEPKVRTPAHAKNLGWHVEFKSRAAHPLSAIAAA